MNTNKEPPSAREINPECPNPDMVAKYKDHFGNHAWEWDCANAVETHEAGKGIVIHCSKLNRLCCIDDNDKHFVNAPKVDPLQFFLNTTRKYFGMKSDE
ncbi:MAG: hypothetical protein CSB48_02585 [Proteobacteria bacterium]|nr:MAG: hypothetical protein CSB48_02585 [Pseudomonadota bacterium]